MNIYKWGRMNEPDVNIDYQNLLTFNAVMSVRNIHTLTAKALIAEGKDPQLHYLAHFIMIFDDMPAPTSVAPFNAVPLLRGVPKD